MKGSHELWVKALYDTRHQSLDDSIPRIGSIRTGIAGAGKPPLLRGKALVQPSSPLGKILLRSHHYRIHRRFPDLSPVAGPFSSIVRFRPTGFSEKWEHQHRGSSIAQWPANEDSETQRYCVEILDLWTQGRAGISGRGPWSTRSMIRRTPRERRGMARFGAAFGPTEENVFQCPGERRTPVRDPVPELGK